VASSGPLSSRTRTRRGNLGAAKRGTWRQPAVRAGGNVWVLACLPWLACAGCQAGEPRTRPHLMEMPRLGSTWPMAALCTGLRRALGGKQTWVNQQGWHAHNHGRQTQPAVQHNKRVT
jgi:hypothetical protein